MKFSGNISELSDLLSVSSKKLEIANKQLETFEKVSKENQEAFSKGILPEKTFKGNEERIKKERKRVENNINALVQGTIKELLKLTE
jgi:hypothetical protein